MCGEGAVARQFTLESSRCEEFGADIVADGPIHSLEQIHGRWNQGGVDEIASYASETVRDDVSKFCEAKQLRLPQK